MFEPQMPAVGGDFLDPRKGEIRSHDLASMSEGTMKVFSLRIQYLLSMIFSLFEILWTHNRERSYAAENDCMVVASM